MSIENRPLKVFLCHAHSDADRVYALYNRLIRDGVDVWLDKANLIGGQDWQYEIPKAVRASDVVIVCHSEQFNKQGYRQKEVKIALDAAEYLPKGEIFIIPARLEECEILDELKRWQWVDLFKQDGYDNLTRALKLRAHNVQATFSTNTPWFKRIATTNVLRKESEKDIVDSTNTMDRSVSNKSPSQSATYRLWTLILILLLSLLWFGGDILDVLAPSITPSTTSTRFLLITQTPPRITVTPTHHTPDPFIGYVKRDSICYIGPSEQYPLYLVIPANTYFDILAKTDDEADWFFISINAGLARCWIKSEESAYYFDGTSLLSIPTAYTITDSICRTGPSTVYKEQTFIPEGWRLIIVGKNHVDAEWLLITPHDSTLPCWIAVPLLSDVDFFVIPLVETPYPPTPIPS